MAAIPTRANGEDTVMRRSLGLACLMVPFAASAQPVPALPEVQGVVSVERKQVPLPEGVWLRAASAEPLAGVVSVALLQVHAGQVTGAVLVQANKQGEPVSDWGTAPDCARSDLPFARVRYASDHDGSCAWSAVVGGSTGEPADPAWAEAARVARTWGWTLPSRWAEAGIRVSDPLAAVQVRYVVGVDAADKLPDDFSAWTERAWKAVEAGKLNLLDAANPMPFLGSPVTAAAPVEEQHESGIPRAVWKTLTYRAVATTIDFTSNVIAIGDVVTAALLSAWSTVAGAGIYLGHELAWDYFDAPPEHHLALPGIGMARVPEPGAQANATLAANRP